MGIMGHHHGTVISLGTVPRRTLFFPPTRMHRGHWIAPGETVKKLCIQKEKSEIQGKMLAQGIDEHRASFRMMRAYVREGRRAARGSWEPQKNSEHECGGKWQSIAAFQIKQSMIVHPSPETRSQRSRSALNATGHPQRDQRSFPPVVSGEGLPCANLLL